MQCAAAGGNDLSILSGLKKLGMPDNFWTETLFGNDFSSLSNLVTGPRQGDSLASILISNPLPGNLSFVAVTNSALGEKVEEVAKFAYHKTTGEQVVVGWKPAVVGTNAYGRTVGAAISTVTKVKAAWDLGTYVGSAIACGIGWR